MFANEALTSDARPLSASELLRQLLLRSGFCASQPLGKTKQRCISNQTKCTRGEKGVLHLNVALMLEKVCSDVQYFSTQASTHTHRPAHALLRGAGDVSAGVVRKLSAQ